MANNEISEAEENQINDIIAKMLEDQKKGLAKIQAGRPISEVVSKPRKKKEEQPKSVAPTVNVVKEEKIEKIDHVTFLSSLKKCGIRPLPNGGEDILSQLDVKNDQINLMRKYQGYNHGEPHGTQLDQWRRHAKTQISLQKGNIDLSDQIPARFLEGYVSGMPNDTKRSFLDLMGRLKIVSDKKNAALALLDNVSSNVSDYRITQEKIKVFNKDIEEIGNKIEGLVGLDSQSFEEYKNWRKQTLIANQKTDPVAELKRQRDNMLK